MNITNITKAKAVQPQPVQDAIAQSAPKDVKNEDAGKETKSRVDSAEISASHANPFDDKRLSTFKSALLYELSSETISKRAEDLKKHVENGDYHVPGDVLAEALYE